MRDSGQYYIYITIMIKQIYDTQEKYSIILEPYKPKDITNKIYDELHGILYHVTDMEIYKNIYIINL